jgi:hypothetical protein
MFRNPEKEGRFLLHDMTRERFALGSSGFSLPLLLPLGIFFDVKMELMKEPMIEGRKENSHEGEKRDAAEQGVEGREELAGTRFEVVDRSHAGKDHGSIQKRVDPGKLSPAMVPRGADTDRKEQDKGREAKIPYLTFDKCPAIEQRFPVMFEHDLFPPYFGKMK